MISLLVCSRQSTPGFPPADGFATTKSTTRYYYTHTRKALQILYELHNRRRMSAKGVLGRIISAHINSGLLRLVRSKVKEGGLIITGRVEDS